MKFKAIAILFALVCLLGLSLQKANASVSPTRKYQFILGIGGYGSFGWNVTAPVYASRSSVVSLSFNSYVYETVNFGSPVRFEVTATLDGGAEQQLSYSILIAAGSHSSGYSENYTPSIGIPSNALLGSSLNVTVFTDLNKWTIFPTEIRDMNYDDLQSQTTSLQSQVTGLQSQVNALTSDKTSLQSQVNALTSDKTSLQSKVNSLQSQVDALQSQIDSGNTTLTYLALSAAAAAIVLACTTVYFATRKPKMKGT